MSSFYVRRSLGTDALRHSMSTELRREDIVHSPEASGSSLDDYWAKQLKMKAASPVDSASSTPSPIPPSSSWSVGPQTYHINGPNGTKSNGISGLNGSIGSNGTHASNGSIGSNGIHASNGSIGYNGTESSPLLSPSQRQPTAMRTGMLRIKNQNLVLLL